MKFRSAAAAAALAASVAGLAVVGAAPAQAATKHSSHTTEALRGYYTSTRWASHVVRNYHAGSKKLLTFHVSPNKHGESAGVVTEVFYRGHWVKATVHDPFWVKLDSRSNGAIDYVGFKAAPYVFRVHVVYNGDRSTKGSVSGWQYFRVTK
ncbi:hypothetical protein [Streptacidiphilus monticola]|uniref:SH3 domain-containing protein n=1 Tax=Streptacidiphilus monticola TaxID=2161674 RepID=A0ABW1G754_9ACTN